MKKQQAILQRMDTPTHIMSESNFQKGFPGLKHSKTTINSRAASPLVSISSRTSSEGDEENLNEDSISESSDETQEELHLTNQPSHNQVNFSQPLISSATNTKSAAHRVASLSDDESKKRGAMGD